MDDRANIGKFETRLPGKVLEGYIIRELAAPALSTGTIYRIGEVFAEKRFPFWFESDLQEVKYPWPMIIHPGRRHGQLIEAAIVMKVERRLAKFDGRILGMDNFFYVGQDLAQHLNSPPIHTCRAYAGEMADELLISYNPSMDREKMAPLCAKANPQSNSRERLSDSEIEDFLKAGRTFVLGVPVD